MTSQDFKCFDGCLGCLADDDSDSCVAVQRTSDVEESTAVEMQPARKDVVPGMIQVIQSDSLVDHMYEERD